MKLYMALNEAGTEGDVGLHARMAVLSARKNTNFDVVMLYAGERNERTRWFERQGVRLVDSKLPYLDVIYKLTEEGRYWTASIGHWLRTNVCLEEEEDEYILYTDVDVVFLSKTKADRFKPSFFAAAPEFQKKSYNYFNAGVMVANVPALRSSYDAFEKYLVENLKEKTYHFQDQIAYNIFYRGRWDKLPPSMNWKPYWGASRKAEIIHFHGPKFGAIAAIMEGTWNWNDEHGVQIGSLFLSNKRDYVTLFKKALENAKDLDSVDHDYIASLIHRIERFDGKHLRHLIDLKFLNYQMFPFGE